MPENRFYPAGRRTVRVVARVPVMLSVSDVESVIHAIKETAILERPSSNTIAKLRTALRRLDPTRESLQAWEELESL